MVGHNELLWIVLMLANMVGILYAYKRWGVTGLYAWIPLSVIIANIQVTKLVSLFGIEATLGNIVYAMSFLATDILHENHGPKAARKAVGIGFFSLVCTTVFMQLALSFTPASGDFVQGSMETIFSLLPRIAAGSFLAYGVSQLHDVYAFSFFKKKWPSRKMLWLRNNLSTMLSQLIDTVIFCLVAFWGVVPTDVFVQILISTYLFKWVVALFDTPFIYLATKIRPREEA